MLRELRIENLAIIESLDLEFDAGLITLTGETGAGKSIILSGINLLIGEKASIEMLRDGSDYLMAEGVFEINKDQVSILVELGIEIDEDEEIIVRRVLYQNGRGKAFVNGKRVPLSLLREVMGALVDLVGQHSHQMLLNKGNHIKLLDKFTGGRDEEIKVKLQKICKDFIDTSKKIDAILELQEELKEKREFFTFQLEEISSVNLKSGEDEDLEDEYKKLFNAGKIKENLFNSLNDTKYGEVNALSLIHHSKKSLENISKYGSEFEEALEKFDKAYYELEEAIYSIENINDDIHMDENRLNEVVDRLDKINNLKKKYGVTIDEILEFKSSLEEKLNTLEEGQFEIDSLSKKKAELLKEYKGESQKLTDLRMEVATTIENNLGDDLRFLNMKEAIFKVSFEKGDTLSPNGLDKVEFLIATNAGQSLKPLSKIASGGEVSRIMLALKSTFSIVDNVPILIFDEIDTGVGGETVRKIASKLKDIGRRSQVVCITHSPAIAAKASQQFFIKKNNIDGVTTTTVHELSKEGRINEVARMLAGKNTSDAVLKHAKDLLEED